MTLVVGSCAAVSQAQTVDEIISRNIQAAGGSKKIQAIQTVRISQKVAAADPAKSFEFVILRKRGNKFRMESVNVLPSRQVEVKEAHQTVEVPGTEIKELSGCDGKVSWMQSGDSPATTQGIFCESGAADINGLFALTGERARALELVGKENVDGRDVFHLRTAAKAGATVSHYFVDAGTFLLHSVITEAHGSHQEDIYTDYRQVNGVMVPFSDEMRWWKVQDDPDREAKLAGIKTAGKSGQQKQLVQKIEINLPLDDSLFAVPKTPQKKP